MGWFNRNHETNEGDEVGNTSGEQTSEIPDTTDGQEKLDTGDSDKYKDFRDSMKPESSSDTTDGTEKLDTGSSSDAGDSNTDAETSSDATDGRGDSEIAPDGGRTDETGR